MAYSPRSCKESDTTERLHFQAMDFPGVASGKGPAGQCRRREMRVRSLGLKDPTEKGMATHSSILAWRIPWTKEPGGLQSIVLQIVRHN